MSHAYVGPYYYADWRSYFVSPAYPERFLELVRRYRWMVYELGQAYILAPPAFTPIEGWHEVQTLVRILQEGRCEARIRLRNEAGRNRYCTRVCSIVDITSGDGYVTTMYPDQKGDVKTEIIEW